MIEYKIFWKKSAVKELKKIPNQFADKIYDAISELSNEPRPDNSKNMVSLSKHYRLKVGDYRVVYSIEDKILIIEIIRIAHRKDVYK
ncbi:MAG: type II toxin-antitoxin system RelE/ParE family toxin [Candidatus Kapabacteria bacterium]|jgi:mRNA interferase RelE/StbE|nr:type II toxin-antitoxin system RelE/ParE family toxin [Candidatus Kapabacteria bacterium]